MATAMKLVKLVSNLGYASRKQVGVMCRAGRVTNAAGVALAADDEVDHADVRVDGERLDPPTGVMLMLNKPLRVTCSHKDPGGVVYDLLPPRFRLRQPPISTVGRLDRDTTGLLLLTDDGALLHRIVSPRSEVRKIYVVDLARDLRGDEAQIFSGGQLRLESDSEALEPAVMETVGARQARLTVTEGRYHQVRRMFAATGNHVLALHRSRIGALSLGNLPAGSWRVLDAADIKLIFQPSGDIVDRQAG